MKRRYLIPIPFAVVAALVGAGVVHTTRFPEVGSTGLDVTPKLSPDEERTAERLEGQVRHQAMAIGVRSGRNSGKAHQMVRYVESELAALGLRPELHEYRAAGRPWTNVWAELGPNRGERIVLCAHYDSYRHSPSANACASGVAALLEAARLLQRERLARPVRVVFCGTGEPPFRATEGAGAFQYAAFLAEEEVPVDLVLALGSVGFYSREEASQSFPFPLRFAFPSTGDWLGVVGSLEDRENVERVLEAWGRVSQVPARGASFPNWMPGMRFHDELGFRENGFETLLLTDTGEARFPDQRTPYDNFHRLDYATFALVVHGIADLVVELADG